MVPLSQAKWAARLVLAFCWSVPVIVRVFNPSFDLNNPASVRYYDYKLEFGCASSMHVLSCHEPRAPRHGFVCCAQPTPGTGPFLKTD